MKGYKVCLDSNRDTKKGIAANSFEDLKTKVETKFEVIFQCDYDDVHHHSANIKFKLLILIFNL